MIQLAERIANLTPSMTFAISSKAKALAAQGVDVCDFSVGEPDFVTPAHVREAAKRALDEGQTKYTSTAGLPELRRLVAEKLQRDNQLPYTAEQVLITTGGKQALFNALLSILGPGDEALIPAPYWVTYPEIVKLAGATPRFLRTTEATGFKVTAEQLADALTPHTRALVLNTPANPTGAVYSEGELRALAEVLVRHQVPVVVDEIYEKLIYSGAGHVSIGSLGEDILALTITCNGFSKAYAATGWRLGYAAGPLPVIKAANAIQSHSTSGPNTFAQYGMVTALREEAASQDALAEMRRTFAQRRDVMVAGVQAIPGLSCDVPPGAFYVFPNVAATGMDSMTFAQRLLEEEAVATVPGVAFGADSNVRLSYATDMATIEEGLTRLERFVRRSTTAR